MSKVIFFVGGTGAQGAPIVKALLRPSEDGTPSPWSVRVLTRDASSSSALKLKEQGAELVQGSFLDFDVIEKGLTGAYGAYINTDGFAVGAQKEMFAGIRIYEIAKYLKVRHFVWSNLEYALKNANWDLQYKTDHLDGKARVAEFLKAQPNEIDDPNGTMWTISTIVPYMEMLTIGLFVPMNVRQDGTVVFAAPLGDGIMPMIALDDLAWWVRHIFDSPDTTTGKNLPLTSDLVSWDQLVETFTRVTGRPAAYTRLTVDEYFELFPSADKPVNDQSATTFRENFGGFWRVWRDNRYHRDLEWIKSVHPGTLTLEAWMKKYKYDGSYKRGFKSYEDTARPAMIPAGDKLKEL